MFVSQSKRLTTDNKYKTVTSLCEDMEKSRYTKTFVKIHSVDTDMCQIFLKDLYVSLTCRTVSISKERDTYKKSFRFNCLNL